MAFFRASGGDNAVDLSNLTYGGRLTATRGSYHTYTYPNLSGKTIKALVLTHETNPAYTDIWIDGQNIARGNHSGFEVSSVNGNEVTVLVPASSVNYYLQAWGE